MAYDSRWLEAFREHAERIGTAVGGAVLRIEHTESTPVLRLGTKAIVDILLVVRNSVDQASYLLALEAAEYVCPRRNRTFRPAERYVHLHVFSEEIARYLDFRDH